jgi:hypothetical protein
MVDESAGLITALGSCIVTVFRKLHLTHARGVGILCILDSNYQRLPMVTVRITHPNVYHRGIPW